MSTLRKNDMRLDSELGKFMDEYLYSKLYESKSIEEYRRIREKEKQLAGIDVELKSGGKWVNIDEKAAFYYSNAMIPTFSLEINFALARTNKLVEGWFVNQSLSTDYYMFIWPNVKCERQKDGQWLRKDLRSLAWRDFTIVEAMLVGKEDLTRALEKRGFGRERLLKHAALLRDKAGSSKGSLREELGENLGLYYSGHLAEKPVNLIVNKKILKEAAKAIWLIAKDGYARIA